MKVPFKKEIPKGRLIPIGGSEDKGSDLKPNFERKEHSVFFEFGILKRILNEAKGTRTHLEIITTASEIPEEVGENYLVAFRKLEASNIGLIHIKSKDDTEHPDYLNRIKKADAVMFSGGNQSRLTMIFQGTEFLRILRKRYLKEDFVVAGTSAGAMAMSGTMITQGSSQGALLKGEVKISPGLDFIQNIIIDTHFVTRGRYGRLANAVASNPGCIGVGLGEDTGVVIKEGNKLEGIGSGLIILFDGHHIRHSNIAELKDGQPISIEHLIVHVMAKGNRFHLKERKFFAGPEH